MPAPIKTCKGARFLKSKQVLCEALFQLLENDGFNQITVNDICQAAQVSRTTFYQHFQDKYDLIQFALEQVSDALRRSSGGCLELEIHDMVDFVYENRKVFKNLNEQNDELLRLLNHVSISSLKKHLGNSDIQNSRIQAEIPAVFLAGGRAWLLLWWINTDCQTPKEQIKKYLVSMLSE